MASRGDDAVIMGGFFLAGLFFRTTWRLLTWLVRCVLWLSRHPVMLGTVVAAWLTVGVANYLPHGWWIIAGFLLFAVWPFTRLIHALSAPVGYVNRPYVVYRSRTPRTTTKHSGGWDPVSTRDPEKGQARSSGA